MEMKGFNERRKEPRHKICIDVKIIAPKSSFWALASNISGGGLELQVPITLNPQTQLMTSMKLQEEFVFHGKVIWTLGDFVDNRWVYRVGTKTDTINFKNRRATTAVEKAELVKKILPQIKAKGTEDTLLMQMFG